MQDGRVLAAADDLASWTSLVSTAVLRRAAPSCAASAIAAVAFSPDATPLVATDCARGGRLGLFSHTDGSWHLVGPPLRVGTGRGPADVLRLETSGATTTSLAVMGRVGHGALEVAWTHDGASWTTSAPLPLRGATSVRASAVGADGRVAVLVNRPKTAPEVFDVGAGGRWSLLPTPPSGAAGLALPDNASSLVAAPVDVFSVHGSALSVYELTPSGTTWSRVQTTYVPLSYGSSS